MKTLITLSLTLLALAFGTSATFADDQQLQNRLASQRHATPKQQKTESIALYTNESGIGRNEVKEANPKPVFRQRSNAHGDRFGTYVPAR